MTETERQKARAELIRGISIQWMIADLTGKTYGQLVQTHLRELGAHLPAGIAASVALCTPEERAASEAIIDDYNAKGYDAAFWVSDAGEVLRSVSCDLNDALFPDTADDAGVFNLFQLVTQNFALMASEQKAFNDFIRAAPSKPIAPKATSHGNITKMLGIAINDHDAGRITRDHLVTILQAAIDNDDILLEDNKLYVVSAVFPLLDAGVLQPSKHTAEFERRMNAEMLQHAKARTRSQPKGSGCLILATVLTFAYLAFVLLNRNS